MLSSCIKSYRYCIYGFHLLKCRLNNKQELLETENPIFDAVVSIDQCAGKQSAQEMQGVISVGDEEDLVLPTTPTASQLLNSTAISEEQFNNWPPNILEPA